MGIFFFLSASYSSDWQFSEWLKKQKIKILRGSELVVKRQSHFVNKMNWLTSDAYSCANCECLARTPVNRKPVFGVMPNSASHFATGHPDSLRLCGGRVKVCYVNTIPNSSDHAISVGHAYIRVHVAVQSKDASQLQKFVCSPSR